MIKTPYIKFKIGLFLTCGRLRSHSAASPVDAEQPLKNQSHGTLLSAGALIGLPNDSGAHDLDELDDHDHQQHADPDDELLTSLVAVDDGDLPKARAAQRRASAPCS